MLLTVFGGIAIGIGRIITTFYALEIGASNAQLGYISALEGLGRLLVILPAGFIIARYGAALVYGLSSLIPALINLMLPLVTVWYGIAVLRGMIGLAIPFRMLSMNSAFLHQLSTIGVRKAGWNRSAQSLGMMVLAPMLASMLTASLSYLWCYVLVALMFVLMTVYGARVLPESELEASTTEAESSEVPANIWQQIKEIWRISVIRESCVTEFFASAVMSVFTTFIIVLALNVAMLSQTQAVMLITIQGVTIVLTGFGMGHALSRYRLPSLQLLSILLIIMGLLLLGLSASFYLLIAGTVLMNLGVALLNMVKTVQLSRLSMSKSKVSGVFNLFNMSGSLFGALSGGLLADWLGLSVLFLFWIPIFIILALLYARR